MVHIRQYNVQPDGGKHPTKLGIAMPLNRYVKLTRLMTTIDEALRKGESFKEHIGGKMYATITPGYKCVNLRKYFKVDDKILPSKFGIALRIVEWEKFKLAVDLLPILFPEITSITACDDGLDHLNQMAYFQCPECSPFFDRAENMTPPSTLNVLEPPKKRFRLKHL